MENLSENIQKLIKDIIDRNLMTEEELNIRIIDSIKRLSENESLHILDNFLNNDLTATENKEAYLYECFLDHINSNKPTTIEKDRDNENEEEEENNAKNGKEKNGAITYLQESIRDLSQKDKVTELLIQTGYSLVISTSQRRYGGPPPGWIGPPPGSGDSKFCSQVHIGRLERNIFEDTLVPILSEHGKVYQLRIMINPSSGYNKGFAFCDFTTREDAEKFIECYNEKPITPGGPPITATLSLPKCRLYVGGFSTHKSKEEVEAEFKTVMPTLAQMTAFTYRDNKKRNRGYGFIEFNSHSDASVAKKQINSGKIIIFNQVLTVVDWAEPLIEETEVGAEGSKKLFIRYGNLNLAEDKLKSLFVEFGEIRNVRKLNSYGFVTFETKEAANAALTAMDKKEIDGVALEVSYSKHSTEDDEAFAKKRKKKDHRTRMRAMDRAVKYRHRWDDNDHHRRRDSRSPVRKALYYDDYPPPHIRHNYPEDPHYNYSYRNSSPRRYDPYPPIMHHNQPRIHNIRHSRYSPSHRYNSHYIDDPRYSHHPSQESRYQPSLPVRYPSSHLNPTHTNSISDYQPNPSYSFNCSTFDAREMNVEPIVSSYRPPANNYNEYRLPLDPSYNQATSHNISPSSVNYQRPLYPPAISPGPVSAPSAQDNQTFNPRPGANIRYW